MSPGPIPDDLRRYLIQCVPTVPFIEAALLMRDSRDQLWQPEALARRLYLGEEDTKRLLSSLLDGGIVALHAGVPTGYRYAPASADLEELWERLAVVYTHNLIEVSTLIHTKPSGTARILADAFKWRKGK